MFCQLPTFEIFHGDNLTFITDSVDKTKYSCSAHYLSVKSIKAQQTNQIQPEVIFRLTVDSSEMIKTLLFVLKKKRKKIATKVCKNTQNVQTGR